MEHFFLTLCIHLKYPSGKSESVLAEPRIAAAKLRKCCLDPGKLSLHNLNNLSWLIVSTQSHLTYLHYLLFNSVREVSLCIHASLFTSS